MEKILIMGGFGFIGKNLIEYFNEKYKVIIIDKYIDKKFLENYKNLVYYQYNFNSNENNLKEIIYKEQPNYIINLISIVSAERNINIFKDMIQNNLNILLQIYEVVKDLKSLKLFLQFGSGEEYGNIISPFNEKDRESPNSPYGLVKQLTTNTAIMLNKNYKFPTMVVRPGNLFGKYQNSRKFLPYIIERLLKNEKIETTLGEQKRDFIDSKNFAKGIELILNNYKEFLGEIVNLSSGNSISLKEIILFCKENINSNSEIKFGKIPYRKDEIMDFKLDINKFENKTRKKLEINIFEELKNYIEIMR